MSFKGRVNCGGRRYYVTTDIDTAEIDLSRMASAIEAMRSWYSVCKDTAVKPTWFTKNDILRGVTNYKKIENYGTEQFLKEDAVLSKWRGNHALEILTYALNKKEAVK